MTFSGQTETRRLLIASSDLVYENMFSERILDSEVIISMRWIENFEEALKSKLAL